jgi:hypothetical protein
MNKVKKEELKKQTELYKDIPSDVALQLIQKNKLIEKIAGELHVQKFPEEYDYHYDDSYNAKQRKKGIHPRALDYINTVNDRRKSLNVKPLNSAGLATSNDSMKMCIAEAKKLLDSKEHSVE